MNLELTEVALKKQFVLKTAHVDGTQIILSAVDALYRGDILLGDLATDMRSKMTFDASPFSRRSYMKGWIDSWVSEKNLSLNKKIGSTILTRLATMEL